MAYENPKKEMPVGGIILKYLDRWYEQPLGAAFAKTQRAEIEALLPTLKGQRLLQLGINPGVSFESVSSIPYYISLAPDIGLKQSDLFVAGSYHALPFLPDSIDVVLMNQVLEFESDLQLVLEEIWRILVGEGQIIIMGFHSLSLWGLIWLFKKKQAQTPWRGHFHSLFEVRQALLKLNFSVLTSKTFFFRPPIQNHYLLTHLEFLEKCGSLIWPIFGAGYLLVAQKKVLKTPPLRSRWQFSELVTDRAMKPAARI
jgi:SAM-dependent methyltransferase